MSRFAWTAALTLTLLLIVPNAGSARAPDTFEEDYAEPITIESPQWWTFELKIGPYTPDYPSFDRVFDDDRGWLLGLELDADVLKIPYVGALGVGVGWNWANYKAKAFASDGTRSGENTELTLFPMSALGVLRIDALARHTVLPFTFAGKVGYDFVRWTTKTGDVHDASGLNMGFRWGLQAALELDFFDPKAARRMDEQFGVNHTFLLFEFFESMTEGTGARSFQFGFGTQF